MQLCFCVPRLSCSLHNLVVKACKLLLTFKWHLSSSVGVLSNLQRLPASSHSRSVSRHKPRHGPNGGNGVPRHSGKAAEMSGNGSCVAGADRSRPGKSRRSRVERWVLTQQALYAERRLSMGQIRYLALLGKPAFATLPRHIERSHCSIRSTVEELQIHFTTSEQTAQFSGRAAARVAKCAICIFMIRLPDMRSCSRSW